MYLTVHGASGLFIGSQVGNPWLAFVLGVVSHFILDMIPHESKSIDEWYERGKGRGRFFLAGIIDTAFIKTST